MSFWHSILLMLFLFYTWCWISHIIQYRKISKERADAAIKRSYRAEEFKKAVKELNMQSEMGVTLDELKEL